MRLANAQAYGSNATVQTTAMGANGELQGVERVALFFRGTSTVTFRIEVSPDDGVTWFPLMNPYTLGTSGAEIAPSLTNANPRCVVVDVAGVSRLRIAATNTNATAGTIDVWVFPWRGR